MSKFKKKMKQLFIYIFLLAALSSFAQKKGNFNFGFESNMQYNLFDLYEVAIDEDNFRSNNYFNVDYSINKFSFGIQIEGYAPNAILNYSPTYNKQIGLATAFAKYKNDKIETTLGNFHEQFGSGLTLRSWEDRQLGINNTLLGGRIKYNLSKDIQLTGLVARQRNGFEISDSNIYGFNSEINLNSFIKLNKIGLNIGLSYVGKDEDYISTTPGFRGDPFPNYVYTTSTRLDATIANFYLSSEYIYKSDDVRIRTGGIVRENNKFDGNAILLTVGYSKKGLGISNTFRRLENMDFYSERNAAGNSFNEQIMNYIPGLSKQHDYSLTNIYVYQPQSGLSYSNLEIDEDTGNIIGGTIGDGEIGDQIDIYYKIKKGTLLGGKYGTKIAANFSHWAGLYTTIDKSQNYISEYDIEYKTDFLNYRDLYFRDANIEIRKKISKKWSSIFSYINLYYNKKVLENKEGVVHANIAIAEATHKIGGGKAIRAEIQHLWTNQDKKNWAAGTLEYNASTKLSFFATDMYNYGKNNEHFYNFGTSYTKGKSRFALSYGKQRGGLLCVGGVCREVSASTGFNFSIVTSF